MMRHITVTEFDYVLVVWELFESPLCDYTVFYWGGCLGYFQPLGMWLLIFKMQWLTKLNVFISVQELEDNLRETHATAQRLETHLKQKEKHYEDKIKVTCQNT